MLNIISCRRTGWQRLSWEMWQEKSIEVTCKWISSRNFQVVRNKFA